MTITMSTIATPASSTPAIQALVEPDFGSGKYSRVMREAFKDAKRLTDLPAERAEQFARDLGSELGRANWDAKVSYGKTGKDGNVTLKDVAKAKMTETKAITLARILSAYNDANAQALKSGLLDVTSASVKLALTY